MDQRLMEQRLTILEERYTAADHALRELSDVIWEQARTIARLEGRIAQLEERQGGAEDGGPVPAAEPPPHY